MVITPIAEAELVSKISSLNSKNSSANDGLLNTIIKLCSQHISKHLTYIFNKSLSQGRFWEWLKDAIVSPLFKKGDQPHRLVSLLTELSKWSEIPTLWRINQHVQAQHELVPQQCGFLKGLSTHNASYKPKNSIKHGKRKCMFLVFSVT